MGVASLWSNLSAHLHPNRPTKRFRQWIGYALVERNQVAPTYPSELCLKSLTLSVDNACQHPFFIAFVHASRPASPRILFAGISPARKPHKCHRGERHLVICYEDILSYIKKPDG